MGLSPAMRRDLEACFVGGDCPPNRPWQFRIGGHWFCPADGNAMTEEAQGSIRCPSCARYVTNYIYDLIELHPHRRNTT